MKISLKQLISSLSLICLSLMVSNCAVGGSGSAASGSASSGSSGGTTPSLSFTNGDGKPELTGVPTAVSSIAAGTELTVTVPVDTDTGYVVVALMSLGTTTPPKAIYFVSVASGTTQSLVVKIGIPTNTAAATYYLLIDLATSAANYALNNFTEYYEVGSVYYKRFYAGGVSPGYYNNNVATTRISVTAAGALRQLR